MAAEVLAFIDEAGNTGNDLDHPDQRNLILACLLVPAVRAEGVFDAVTAASRALGGAEFHTGDVYGGKGAFKKTSLPDRVAALQTVTDGLIRANAYCFWDGLPKVLWKDAPSSAGRRPELWKSALNGFLYQLHRLVELLYPKQTTEVIVDENSWVSHGRQIVPPDIRPWPRFAGGAVYGQQSKMTPGLQAADFLVHTLYRANKNRGHASSANVELTGTDRLAIDFHRQLVGARRFRPLGPAVAELLRRGVVV